jgi:DNA-binding transcriptional MocR family regulator
MSDFSALSTVQLNDRYLELQAQFEGYKNQKLNLDMSRGKPCTEQLDLSLGMLDCVSSQDSLKASDGTDCRNYGGLDGLPEAKQLFSHVLEVSTKEIIVGGTSSLNMMHDTIARAMIHGVLGSDVPWGKLPVVKFLCPSPGYDRHFAICELFNIEMIIIEMKPDGPDMDQVEKLVHADETIKGIWCVPKYSNPDGITYSVDVVNRLAAMNCKAKDFRIICDDAYTMHHLTDEPDALAHILTACKAAGNADRVFMFSSTSKITFASAGIALMAASEDNLNLIKKQLSVQTIGPDKINQLRHVRFFKDMENLKTHMAKQAAIIKPKFDIVLSILDSELSGKNIATWNKPNGGYFISLNTLDGCATAVVNMAAEAGVTLTKAGASFPYGKDPQDRNIRIAPTFPAKAEVKNAIEVLCLCVQLISIKKYLTK